MMIVASEGSYVWDGDGTKLLDFSGQLVFTNPRHSSRLSASTIPARTIGE
jgi:taurine---2-oxoglutarate transaminase